MFRLLRGLGYWSLQITGGTIVGFHMLPDSFKNQIKGFYRATQNTYRTALYLRTTLSDYKQITQSDKTIASLFQFYNASEKAATGLAELCIKNKGVYARIVDHLKNITILPRSFTDKLQELKGKQQAEALPYQEVKRILTTNLGAEMKEVFMQFNKTPIHISTFNQFHYGIINEQDRQVVVKIKKPEMQYQLQWDLWYIQLLENYCLRQLEKCGVKESVTEQCHTIINGIVESLKNELDFELETKNASKYRELLIEKNSIAYVPYYHRKYCNQNVIIRQHIAGPRITDKQAMKKLGVNPMLSYRMLINALEQVLQQRNIINSSLGEKSLLVRKLSNSSAEDAISKLMASNQAGEVKLNYQVVLLDHTKYTQNQRSISDGFVSFWEWKKSKAKIMKAKISLQQFYHKMARSLKMDSKNQDNEIIEKVLNQKFYFFEPMVQLLNKLNAAV